MAAASTPQPFWTSRTFWVLALGIVFNLARQTGRLPLTFDATETINMILLLLGIVFRWQANQPLTSNPAAVAEPPAGDHK